MDDEEKYSLFRENIIHFLAEYPFFEECMLFNFDRIGVRYGAIVTISKRRLKETFSYWKEDIRRLLRDGMPPDTATLDSFKHASVIAFWLRRTIPINSIMPDLEAGATVPSLHQRQREFYQYGNEICALVIGHQICLNYHAAKWVRGELRGGNYKRLYANDNKSEISLENRDRFLKSITFPSELIKDFSRVLKHKTVSPYSLYMMYKALLF